MWPLTATVASLVVTSTVGSGLSNRLIDQLMNVLQVLLVHSGSHHNLDYLDSGHAVHKHYYCLC